MCVCVCVMDEILSILIKRSYPFKKYDFQYSLFMDL